MRTITYDFSELPLFHCAVYAHGQAEIEYSDYWSGFMVRDIYLAPHETGRGKRITPGNDIHPAIVAALQEHDVEAIETAIKDHIVERKEEYA